MFRWAVTQAGTLPRQEFVFRGVFDEELFSEIRDKKLIALLGREMIETEPKWLNYEFEQAQAKIDLGDMILEVLVTEAIDILNSNAAPQERPGPQSASESSPVEDSSSGAENNRRLGKQQQRDLEDYEAQILREIGEEAGAHQPGSSAGDGQSSANNSKDSDFSINERKGREAAARKSPTATH